MALASLANEMTVLGGVDAGFWAGRRALSASTEVTFAMVEQRWLRSTEVGARGEVTRGE